jgi:hypothetical protein
LISTMKLPAALCLAALLFLPVSCTGPQEVRESTHGPLSLVFPGGRPSERESYAGSGACRPCHREIYSFWEGTRHAGSLDTLRSRGMEEAAPCLRCHVLGYGVESGYRKDRPSSLGAVGCEACHGPSSKHVSRPGEVMTSGGIRAGCPPCTVNQVCRLCHTTSQDPDFDPGTDFIKVRCPDKGSAG